MNHLIQLFHVHKCFYIQEHAGIPTSDNQHESFINLHYLNTAHYSSIYSNRLNAYQTIGRTAPFCSFVITSFGSLLDELFTIKGAGTYCRYFQIDSFSSPHDSTLIQQVHTILESSFSKPLAPNFSLSKASTIYIQTDGDGLAVIERMGSDFAYLDKFAVLPLAQGTGLGRSLWLRILDIHPKLLWRASLSNPLNAFYTKNATGSETIGNWNVYWKGCSLSEAKPYLDAIGQKPSSFS